MFLKRYTQRLRDEGHHVRSLRIFDFDDTLVCTDAAIRVTSADGTVSDMLSGAFARYKRRPGDVFDYTAFNRLVNPRPISWMIDVLRCVYDAKGAAGVAIVSLRPSTGPIREALVSMGMGDVEVVALDNGVGFTKADWVDARIRRDGLELVEVFDDSYANVAGIARLRDLHAENTNIIVRHVIHTQAPTHGYVRRVNVRQPVGGLSSSGTS